MKNSLFLTHRKKIITQVFAAISIVFTLSFGIFDVVTDKLFIGFFLLGACLINVIVLFAASKGQQEKVLTLLMISGTIFFYVLFVHGGMFATGVLWLFPWIMIVLCLEGSGKGTKWLLLLLFLLIISMLLSFFHVLKLPYHPLYLAAVFAGLFLLAYTAYFLESVRGKTQKAYETNNEKLKVLNNTLAVKNNKIFRDLKLAKKIQENMINFQKDVFPAINIEVFFNPLNEVGGDIFDIYKRNEKNYRIFLADATGHGIQAALMTMIIKSEYDRLKELHLHPDLILEKLNNLFIKDYSMLNAFFTCVIFDIDFFNKKLTYSFAGHPAQYLISQTKIHKLKTKGTMIGVMPDITFTMGEVSIKKNDKILVFTDGLFEEFSEDQEELGEERILELIEARSHLEINSLLNELVGASLNWANKHTFQDDVTIIGLEIRS